MQQESLGERLLGFVANYTIVILLVVLLVLFSTLNLQNFLSLWNIQNIAEQVSVDAILAFGEVCVLIAGGLDISIGSVLALAAALTMGLQDYGVGVAVATSLLMGLVVGVLNGWFVTKARIPAFITTLGTMTLVHGVMLTYTRQQPIPGKIEWFTFFGSGRVGPVPVAIIITLILLVIFHVVLTYTRFGRKMYAVGGNEEAARVAGIRVGRSRFWAFVLSGFCAALGGVLLASRLNSSTIHIGSQTGLLVTAGCIMGGASLLGGRGSAIGAFLGVLALTILGNGMNLLSIFNHTQLAIRAIILILVVAIDAIYANIMSTRAARTSAIGAHASERPASSA
jgi:ribose transport system permease protein